MGTHLLLVEFLFADRYSQFRSKDYPFLLGQARDICVEAHWLCCWAPQGRTSRTRYVMDLGDAAAALLLEAIDEADPTHIIFSEKLGDELKRRFDERCGKIVVCDLSTVPVEQIVTWPARWLPEWLGVDASVTPYGEDSLLVDAVSPDYRSRCLPAPKDRAEPSSPPVHIVAGPECIYRKPLSRNPAFVGVDIPDGVRPFGCSFCAGPLNGQYPFETPPVELALRQCLGALETEDRCTSRCDYVIDGGHLSLRIDEFLLKILEHPFPPSRFYFSFRIDELLSVATKLEALLPDLERAGHCIEIYNMGVENFSPRENERLNKGLRAEQIEEVTKLTSRWESGFPETLVFGRRGGFGLILFTPWTTPDDLKINLEAMNRHGVDGQGFGLTSKLQILPETAIAALARRDDVLCDSFESFHYYDSGCFFRWDQRELPWRFHSPLVAHLYSIACRIVPITTFDVEDRLFQRVQKLYEPRRLQGEDPIAFFSKILEVAQQNGETANPREILDRLVDPIPASLEDRGASELPTKESHRLSSELTALLLPKPASATAEHRKPVAIAGFTVISVKPSSGALQAIVEMSCGDDMLELYIHRRADGAHHFVAAGLYTISFAKRTPLDNPSKRKAVLGLAALLERIPLKTES